MKHAGLNSIVLALALIGLSALGQGAVGLHPPATPGLPAPVLVLRDSNVQADLLLTHNQKVAVTQVRGEVDDAMRLFLPGPGPSGEDWAATMEEFDRIQSYGTERLRTILSPSQWKRLREIRIQFAGTRAVLDPEVARDLGIDSDQYETIAKQLRAPHHRRGHEPNLDTLLSLEQKQILRTLAGRVFIRSGERRSM